MESTTYILRQFEIAVGDGAVCRLPHATPLLVEFIYDPGYPDLITEANGDPGAPGVPASFDFKRIVNHDRLVLSDLHGALLLVIAPSTDLYDFLAPTQLDAIEQAVLRELRAQAADARLEAHLGAVE